MSYHPFTRTASALAFSAAFGAAAVAATPKAGSVIGNQAVATYKNAAGDTITVTSNTVETIVQQVAGVTLTSDNNETIAPGGKAFLPHIITNEGNGADSFLLLASEDGSGTLNTTDLIFYPDANMDGVADSATEISETPALAPGEQFGVVIEATVASDASGSDTITVSATSTLDGNETSINTDTLTISNAAIVELVKSMVADAASGGSDPSIVDPGDTVTITLTYSSTGLAAADNYIVEDILDGNLTYVPDSARWSDSTATLQDNNATTETDGQNGSNETITWDYDNAQRVNFLISRVGSGRSGSVTFQATIDSAANAGKITNVATQQVDGNAFPPSNTASITVDNQYAVAIADTAINADLTPNGALVSGTDDDAANNDFVTEVTDAYQGGVIAHEFVLTNLSNRTDSLQLQVENTDFPDGTTFRFVGDDGITPIIGSVGPLAAGTSTTVTLLATLPTNLSPVANADYNAVVTTTSDGSGVSDTSTARFTGAVLASSVDLQNNVTGSEGFGADPTNSGVPWVTINTDPGSPVSFDMVVENNGPVSDSYNLSLAQGLPPGWTVEFLDAAGTAITNTGTIASNASATFTAVITPVADELPGDTLVDIAISSSVSGQGDRIVNRVSVNPVYDVEIIDNQNAQASPGGIVDLLHTITNNGNVAITDAPIDHTGLVNFSGAIFWDRNANGVLDASEPVINDFSDFTDNVAAGTDGLAPGDSVSVIYRVQTPSTSTTGVNEVGTITLGSTLNSLTTPAADSDETNNNVEDRIVIISGDVTLAKFQYIDADCDGSGVPADFTKTRQDVEPGQCIRYLVEATNTGSASAINVTISDTAPAYTSVTDCGGTCPEDVFPVGSSVTVSSSSINSSHGDVLPGGKATLEFTVQVDR